MSATLQIRGEKQLYASIEKLIKWDKKRKSELTAIGEKVGRIFVSKAQTNIKDYHKDIRVIRKNTTNKIVRKGQLRRSVGTWIPESRRTTVLAGPRANNWGRKVPGRDDGWFAHMVEGGNFAKQFGGTHKTKNTGVFKKSKRATQNRSKKLQQILLKKEFARYVKMI
jgi:hypothetical protein